ncbi:MAG: tRNA 2-thiouridine synthesizing protein A [Oleiphilaceae bacterium]|jgi:tRNA 2-thiouridine synthesizing protein A
MEYKYKLDTLGLYCPEPIMMLHSKISEMVAGELVQVIASDPATQRDIPKFCQFLGHDLVYQEEIGQQFFYIIKKS